MAGKRSLLSVCIDKSFRRRQQSARKGGVLVVVWNA